MAAETKIRRLKEVKVKLDGREYTIPPFFREKKDSKGDDRTLLNDTFIEFYMCNYMYKHIFPQDLRAKCQVFGSFFYTSLQMRIRTKIKEPLKRSELLEAYDKIFRKRDTSVLDKELLIIPVHIETPKHWFLVLIHNPAGAIRHFFEVRPGVHDVDFDENQMDCRIIIMDSLFGWPKYRAPLTVHHNQVSENLRLWLQMTAAVAQKELMAARVRKVVCEKLPRQQNSYDCGIFMIVCAEYFTVYNSQWMAYDTETLKYLRMDASNEQSLATEEPRLRLERLLEALKVESH
ncbi:unnamed protein product [Caenorhabditis sp. 36 PRJEB53466]|nr:unnamed protein product [Caenorhabditis sp. 36 PRJEB53466]